MSRFLKFAALVFALLSMGAGYALAEEGHDRACSNPGNAHNANWHCQDADGDGTPDREDSKDDRTDPPQRKAVESEACRTPGPDLDVDEDGLGHRCDRRPIDTNNDGSPNGVGCQSQSTFDPRDLNGDGAREVCYKDANDNGEHDEFEGTVDAAETWVAGTRDHAEAAAAKAQHDADAAVVEHRAYVENTAANTQAFVDTTTAGTEEHLESTSEYAEYERERTVRFAVNVALGVVEDLTP